MMVGYWWKSYCKGTTWAIPIGDNNPILLVRVDSQTPYWGKTEQTHIQTLGRPWRPRGSQLGRDDDDERWSTFEYLEGAGGEGGGGVHQ